MSERSPSPKFSGKSKASPDTKHLTSIFSIALLMLGFSLIFFNLIGQQSTLLISKNCPLRLNLGHVLPGSDSCLMLEKATTEPARIQGLSDRLSMPQNQGMLFVFDESGSQCMWMKDMHFGLDMVWLNENKEIVKITQNVTPDTYPNSFCSKSPAKYVIELNSGLAQKSGLRLGQKLYL